LRGRREELQNESLDSSSRVIVLGLLFIVALHKLSYGVPLIRYLA
jgi:hypothetical protein